MKNIHTVTILLVLALVFAAGFLSAGFTGDVGPTLVRPHESDSPEAEPAVRFPARHAKMPDGAATMSDSKELVFREPCEWDAVFEAGGRLAFGKPGAWTDGPKDVRWHRSTREFPGGVPTGVRFLRGDLAAQIAAVESRHHWRFVEFNARGIAPERLDRWLAKLARLEGIALRKMTLGPSTFRAFRGLGSLAWMSLHDSKVSGGALGPLAGGPLRDLNLGDTDIGDDDLAPVGRLPRLVRLDLSGTAITDDGLRNLGELHTLRSLELRELEFTGAGLRHLDLARLEVLDLEDSSAEDVVFEGLRASARLRTLKLRDTRIRGFGVTHLAGLAALESIDLDDCPMTGPYDSLPALATLPNLRTLTLEDSGVDDRALPHLLALVRLRDLAVEDTRISEEGLERLVEGLPRCRVR